MFKEIYHLLKNTESKEVEIQILNGLFEKPNTLKERIKKIKEKLKNN